MEDDATKVNLVDVQKRLYGPRIMTLDTTSYDIPVARTVADLRAQVADWHKDGLRVALVPTMGALHIGHMSLIDEAKKHADRIVVSIFVNPTQFAPHEDFDAYPREEGDDARQVSEQGGHLIYAPTVDEMYPDGPELATRVHVAGVSEGLCGASRPHFFGGVATVVSKLLLQCGPDVAIFGEKDYQQLLVIKRMVRDLCIPTEIVGAELIRDDDGLATSSRNKYLTAEDRQVALAINRGLKAANDADDAEGALTIATQTFIEGGIAEDKIDYLEIRDAEDLTPLAGPIDRPARIFAAAFVGKARLIDNMAIGPKA